MTSNGGNMEYRYNRTGNENIKRERNILILEILVYISMVLVLFGSGGDISKLATEQVQLISAEGIIKIAAMICMLILISIIFFLGPIRILTHADYYCYLEQG